MEVAQDKEVHLHTRSTNTIQHIKREIKQEGEKAEKDDSDDQDVTCSSSICTNGGGGIRHALG